MKLSLDLSQKQTLSQQMMQALKILQMGTTELAEYIEQLSLENPMIEIEQSHSEDISEKQYDLQRKLDWLESTDRQNRVYYATDRSGNDPAENLYDLRISEESLADYLSAQILLSEYPAKDRAILDYLIVSLDSRGYFSDDIADVAAFFHTSEAHILSMLEEIWQLDPSGVGARNLSECLSLQLLRIPHSELSETLVKYHLEDIAKNHLHVIAQKLHRPIEDIVSACNEIQALNPLPGNAFSNREHLRYITPDAVVVKLEKEFTILINDSQLPRFRIDEYYKSLLKETNDQETKQYLKDKLAEANNLENGIALRTSTLSKIMHVLVEHQHDFFLSGIGHKRPLRLIDIAEAVDMHESTISRALRSKYLQCQWGIFPLNYFLTSTAAISEETGESQTQEYIKSIIKNIIDAEDKKKPLSDEAISKRLKESGISISRRTVNKYRVQMGLPDKSGRKAWS